MYYIIGVIFQGNSQRKSREAPTFFQMWSFLAEIDEWDRGGIRFHTPPSMHIPIHESFSKQLSDSCRIKTVLSTSNRVLRSNC